MVVQPARRGLIRFMKLLNIYLGRSGQPCSNKYRRWCCWHRFSNVFVKFSVPVVCFFINNFPETIITGIFITANISIGTKLEWLSMTRGDSLYYRLRYFLNFIIEMDLTIMADFHWHIQTRPKSLICQKEGQSGRSLIRLVNSTKFSTVQFQDCSFMIPNHWFDQSYLIGRPLLTRSEARSFS